MKFISNGKTLRQSQPGDLVQLTAGSTVITYEVLGIGKTNADLKVVHSPYGKIGEVHQNIPRDTTGIYGVDKIHEPVITTQIKVVQVGTAEYVRVNVTRTDGKVTAVELA